MKLCFIVNQLYKAGGIERTITQRLNELSKYYDVYLITLENANRSYFFGKPDGVKCIDLNLNFERRINGGFKKSTTNVNRSLRAYIKLQRTIQKIKPDFTINVIGMHSLFFLPYLSHTGLKVLEHHSSFYQSKVSKAKKYIYNKYEHHIFLTEEECNLADFIDKNKVVIPNPVQMVGIENIPYKAKRNRIIAAGRVLDIKGFDRLIKAWATIHLDFPDWIIEIYGESDQNVLSELKGLITAHDLEDSFYIRPATPDILELINDSKIYAMTSNFECFPMVLLEAISLGALVVAFDCPTGPRNIIDNTNGYLVENDNIELYAQTLKQAILSDKKASHLAANGHRRSQNFALDKVIDKWKMFFSAQK